jgi:pimeloyl-ACP methyl ester carboxylesterase
MQTTLSDLEHVIVDVGAAQLHVALAGPPSGAPVVLLHGFPEFWYGWRRQIGPLADAGYRVIVPDLRGYNLSSKPTGSENYTPEALRGDVLGLFDHFGIKQAAVIGHDWGGLLGWWLAMHHAQRVERLAILNAPHPHVFREHFSRRPTQQLRSGYLLLFQLPRLPELLLSRGQYFWLRQAMRWTSRRDAFSEEDFARYQQAWAQPGALRAMLDWYRGARRSSAVSVPARVRVPTLLIWGERDFALGRRLAEDSLQLCENGRLQYLPKATHWLQHEEAPAVNRLLLDFLQRDPAPAVGS